jgi:hypothetical protein
MHRSALTLVLVIAALAAAPSASAAPALSGSTVVDDLGLPLRGWSVSGRPGLQQVRLRAHHTFANSYAIQGRALRLSAGGSIQRSLPPRPWSLSLDARIPRGSTLRIDLGGPPINLMKRADGKLVVGSGDVGATLPAGTAGPRGWHHIEIAGFEPAELHVDGTRIPNDIVQSARIRLRAARGAVQLTGLVTTRRDDRRALLLHRLASIHARTPDRRFPIGTGVDGVLRFESGRNDGFYAGSLWHAYGLTGDRLFRDWSEKATFEHMLRNQEAKPPAHWQGLRFYESSAVATQRTCNLRRPAHRCRLFGKSTSSAPIYLMSALNWGNRAIPSLLYPRKCPSCASPDEVEIRIEAMMDAAMLEWSHTTHELSRRMQPNLQIDPSPYGPAALKHADVVAQLLVRPDGSTAEAVRTSRLDGTVLGYETTNGLSPDSTWARGHASAVYGFARMGLRFRKRGLIAVAERAAGYLEANLPASRVPPYDFAAPAGPADHDAAALYAAGLLRLAEACERVSGACADGGAARWKALGGAMLDALLARLNSHVPVGASPEGDTTLGIDYMLEAIERSDG